MKARFLWRAHRARLLDQATELALIRRYSRPGDFACDVGANKGSERFWRSPDYINNFLFQHVS